MTTVTDEIRAEAKAIRADWLKIRVPDMGMSGVEEAISMGIIAGRNHTAVKSLQWEERDPNHLYEKKFWRASTTFDWGYRIYECSEGFVFEKKDYPTLDEAKAAAQADYETRIRSALL